MTFYKSTLSPRLIHCFIFAFISVTLTSCAKPPMKASVYPMPQEVVAPPPAPVVPAPLPPPVVMPKTPPVMRHDVFHNVAPGETIWRISKMYDVPMEDIMRANKLRDKTDIKMGACLVIPHAAPLQPVIPLLPSGKWKYIIVHHSATDFGNALQFHYAHKNRGWEGLGYHFVIDNGTMGKQDGQIEVSPRWLKQKNGAHCKANGMNYRGIGICLVGNYSKGDVSDKQMEALVHLINLLREYYHIPLKNIMGHGQVSGARTECPGLKFPWTKFKRRLRQTDF